MSYIDEQLDRDDSYPFGQDPQGFLIYTADGFVSAQLMKMGRPGLSFGRLASRDTEEYQASGSGYIAYCGTYEVDEVKATVTHIPSVSLLPNLIGKRQCRSIELKAIGSYAGSRRSRYRRS